MTTPDQYCQEKAAASGSSFYYSFLFLPPPRRAAITALYAFCREVDDVVDECSEPDLARTKLAWWRDELGRMKAGQPQHPVTRALAPQVDAYRLDVGAMREIIDGMEMDLDQNRYLDFEGLRLYCHRVAGVVGLLAARIFGGHTPGSTDEYAQRLGLAFQMTNIIRDVGEDARRGRIYLPLEDLRRFGVTPAAVLECRDSPELARLLAFEAQRARDLYREAFALLDPRDYRDQRAGLIMAAIYSTLLDEIERDGFRVLGQRTSLTPIRKFWLAWRTWMRARPPAIGGQ
ncbi:MAG: presqualene diphosphate synthase HpnD [Burkholderiaceae bacterium]|nr:presqualene diphosphate synthase HpnD [Burkholderiaceae bacterium]MEB2319805.1 presqualene diphosphate synthase HpnD [Pseudomonadota bacterium]